VSPRLLFHMHPPLPALREWKVLRRLLFHTHPLTTLCPRVSENGRCCLAPVPHAPSSARSPRMESVASPPLTTLFTSGHLAIVMDSTPLLLPATIRRSFSDAGFMFTPCLSRVRLTGYQTRRVRLIVSTLVSRAGTFSTTSPHALACRLLTTSNPVSYTFQMRYFQGRQGRGSQVKSGSDGGSRGI
jgi:hypothetical protein